MPQSVKCALPPMRTCGWNESQASWHALGILMVGSRGRWISGTHWPTNLTCLVSSRPIKRPFENSGQHLTTPLVSGHQRLSSRLPRHMYTHTHPPHHMHTCLHHLYASHTYICTLPTHIYAHTTYTPTHIPTHAHHIHTSHTYTHTPPTQIYLHSTHKPTYIPPHTYTSQNAYTIHTTYTHSCIHIQKLHTHATHIYIYRNYIHIHTHIYVPLYTCHLHTIHTHTTHIYSRHIFLHMCYYVCTHTTYTQITVIYFVLLCFFSAVPRKCWHFHGWLMLYFHRTAQLEGWRWQKQR